MYLAISLGLFAILIAASAGFVLWRLMQQAREPLPDPAWLLNFSADRYRPMLRLLSEGDYAFLAASGLDPAAIRRLRSERRKIFRAYLSNLIRDFNRIHRAARIFLLDAEQDSDAAVRLMQIRATFELAVLRVRVRLALHALGLGTVDVRGLLDALDLVRADLKAFVPGAQPMQA